FDTLDIYDRLEQIHCPTLVLGAIDDKVLTAQASFEIAQKLGCACYFYESIYGHCAFDEAPDYKQRLLDFFTQ
ncbi:MAG: alpha/beta hydrolase, partial [Ruminococcus sp.]|nr:alpha/beta hydrolase [Ruminococcus sp.]